MAIILEEEQQNSVGIVTVLVWAVIVGVVVAATYYLFFKNPDFASFSTPENFRHTEALAKVDLDPERLMRSAAFLELKPYISLPQPTKMGRANPLLGF
ncbi:MAG: hypothetical protein HYW65_04270 [Candidatus Liptonbacteria bacterium]|nr:hypothetical protein [Candidatus Liptonbacteria bacterium]